MFDIYTETPNYDPTDKIHDDYGGNLRFRCVAVNTATTTTYKGRSSSRLSLNQSNVMTAPLK